MSVPAHSTEISLPSNEGKLRLIIESWEIPSTEEVSSRELRDGLASDILIHDSCGESFVATTVSPKKRVMFCKRCGLRLEIPQQITLGELSVLFSQKPLSLFTR